MQKITDTRHERELVIADKLKSKGFLSRLWNDFKSGFKYDLSNSPVMTCAKLAWMSVTLPAGYGSLYVSDAVSHIRDSSLSVIDKIPFYAIATPSVLFTVVAGVVLNDFRRTGANVNAVSVTNESGSQVDVEIITPVGDVLKVDDGEHVTRAMKDIGNSFRLK